MGCHADSRSVTFGHVRCANMRLIVRICISQRIVMESRSDWCVTDAIREYIGVMIQTEGSSEPEVIINPKENFNAKFDYYMAAYDDDLILIAAKGKKDIRITGAAAGASFEDIQSQLIDEKASSGWKEQIADAVDRVVDKMLKETPPETEEERQNCETMRETIKGMFITQRRSKTGRSIRTVHSNSQMRSQPCYSMKSMEGAVNDRTGENNQSDHRNQGGQERTDHRGVL